MTNVENIGVGCAELRILGYGGEISPKYGMLLPLILAFAVGLV
jgi:hypothetical protein